MEPITLVYDKQASLEAFAHDLLNMDDADINALLNDIAVTNRAFVLRVTDIIKTIRNDYQWLEEKR